MVNQNMAFSYIVSLIIVLSITTFRGVYAADTTPQTNEEAAPINNDNLSPDSVTTTAPAQPSQGQINIANIPEYDPSEDDINGGGVWSSIGMVAVVICGCICMERLYSSCKKVYQKRTGRYGFSRLQNQTFNEFDGSDDELELNADENDDVVNSTTANKTKDSDQESV